MSVVVSKRNESRLEVITHANNLRDMLIDLCQRNFGIKDYTHIVRRNCILGIDKSENYSKYIVLMTSFKDRINQISASIVLNLVSANSIYPTCFKEYNIRRSYQTKAISNCEQVKSELQTIVRTFDVNVNIYKRYIEGLNKEIDLIKKWRRSDNKIKSKL